MAWFCALCVILIPVIRRDFAQRKIRNIDVVLIFLIGTAFIYFDASGFNEEKSNYLISSILAFVCFLPFYLLGWMGAGDVKLAAALGLWLGFDLILETWLLSVFMAILAGVFFYYKTFRILTFWQKGGISEGGNKKVIPYGAFMAISALIVGAEKVI